MLTFAMSKYMWGTKQQPRKRLLFLCKRYKSGNRVGQWKHPEGITHM